MGRAAGWTQRAGAKSARCVAVTGKTTGRLISMPVKVLLGPKLAGPPATGGHSGGEIEERLNEIAVLYGRIGDRMDHLVREDPSRLPDDLALNASVSQARRQGERITDLAPRRSPLDPEEVRFLGAMVLRDMRAVRKVQAHLVLARNLSWMNDLLGGVAHELNSALTVVLGMSDLGMQLNLEGEGANFFEQILNGALLARDIVSTLPRTRGKKPGRRIAADLGELLDHVVDMAEAASPSPHIAVRTAIPPNARPVQCDPDHLRLAFLNLIHNSLLAVQEDPGRGTVAVSVQDPGERILVKVEDDGPGIQPAKVSKVFTPFFSDRNGAKGLGIGLCVCRRIVEEHGGEVRVVPTNGRGACFEVELPAGP
jgi:signal transduction histidine kinase